MGYVSISAHNGGFRWLTEKKINKIDLAKYKEDTCNKMGMILEVDLEYPQELYDLHNDLSTRKNESNKRDVIPIL